MTGISCDDARYTSLLPLVGAMGVAYALGVPGLFYYLESHFEARGKAGDKIVANALEWAYGPYRDGKEWCPS